MRCPQCGAETPDEEWNCVSCRINLYWAVQHYDELAQIRERYGLSDAAPSATFLINAHKHVMADRAERGGNVENKVRAVARKVMRRKTAPADSHTRADHDA
jgi:hypothetical protein